RTFHVRLHRRGCAPARPRGRGPGVHPEAVRHRGHYAQGSRRTADGRLSDSEENGALSVLIIDDQSHVRSWTRAVLNGLGIDHVVEAPDGRAAVAKVTQPGAHFDLILCDLGMPGRDGIETIRSLAALGLDSAVAILSMEEEKILEAAALLVKGQGLRLVGALSKPLTPEKLETVLARMRS